MPFLCVATLSYPPPLFWPGLSTLWRWEGAKRKKKKKERRRREEEKKKSGPFVASDVLLIL